MTVVSKLSNPALLPRTPAPQFLVFIRHGETDWNAEGRMQGQRDIPLNVKGLSQAAGNGRRLRGYFEEAAVNPQSLDFVASPLGRTRHTMDLVRQELGMDNKSYRTDPRLMELTFGAWEGFTLQELAKDVPDKVAERRNDKWRFTPPGGESYEMLRQRIEPWLAEVNRPTVVVSHGGVFRVIRGLLEGLATDAVPKLDTPQDRVFVWRDSSGTWL